MTRPEHPDTAASHPRPLPGETPPHDFMEQLIRVNHAGEYGAKQIYAGQLAVLRRTCPESAGTVAHMAAQEEAHLAYFEQEMRTRRVRPTALLPLWHAGGFALGAVTALMGEKAAMACTVAVESVIDRHYAGQEACLDDSEQPLKETIARFRAEEMEHHDAGLAHGAEEAPAYTPLTAVIRGITQGAIALSKRW